MFKRLISHRKFSLPSLLSSSNIHQTNMSSKQRRIVETSRAPATTANPQASAPASSSAPSPRRPRLGARMTCGNHSAWRRNQQRTMAEQSPVARGRSIVTTSFFQPSPLLFQQSQKTSRPMGKPTKSRPISSRYRVSSNSHPCDVNRIR